MKAVALLLFLFSFQLGMADEIQSAIDEGSAAYGEGQYSQAAAQFELAAQLLREKSGSKIAEALPEAPEGWTTDGEAEVQAVGAAVMGGMTSASQTYRNDEGGSVNVRIMSDSPMVGQISMLLNNPAMIQQMGQKVVKVDGAQGVLSYDKDSRSGTITGVANNKFFITIDGSSIEPGVLQEFAGAIDFSLLSQQ
ncbi:MAG: hypothetical protein ACQKBT_05945 [Puniceicoccales bacterium]